jgi:exopolyphosphatase / guanosine-5'-triphosphate,3'-diphosphate pyrophosphatase
VREASNREVFVKKLQQKIDVQVRVLSGEEESFLVHMGMIHRAGVLPDEIIKTVDIGGGSVELSWSKGEHYLFGHSFDLGAIRLTQSYLHSKIFTREMIGTISDRISKELKAFHAKPPIASKAIGSSGNVRAIFKMVQAIYSQPFSKALPEITVGSLETLLEFTVGKSPQQIHAFFDIGLERSKSIVAALCVLNICMRHFEIYRLTVTDAGLREGVVYYWSQHGHLTFPPLSY